MMPPQPQSARDAGFTLLEVMVAVAILALALTAVFSSQAGAMKVAQRARRLTVASVLARCKMAELEEGFAVRGLPAVESSGGDACCAHAKVKDYDCTWKVERIVLPDVTGSPLGKKAGEKEGDAEKKGDAPSGSTPGSGITDSLNNLGAGNPGGLPGSANTNPLAAQSILNRVQGGGGGDMIAQLAMSFALPVLKPTIEEQVRRVSVKVRWKEGRKERSFDLIQFAVSEQAAPLPGLQPGQQPGQQPGTTVPGQQPGTTVPGQQPSTNTVPGVSSTTTTAIPGVNR